MMNRSPKIKIQKYDPIKINKSFSTYLTSSEERPECIKSNLKVLQSIREQSREVQRAIQRMREIRY